MTVRDVEHMTATSGFTQLMSSECLLSSVSVVLHPHRPYGLLRTGNPGQPPELSLSSECLCSLCCFTSAETIKSVRDRELRTATSVFTQLLNSE